MTKGMYFGAETELPVYEEQIIDITGDNIGEYFSMTHNNTTYGFKWNATQNAFVSGNSGYNSTTGQTTFTALKDIPNLSFDYSWGSEGSCDRFYLTVAGTTVQNGVSGTLTAKSWSGNLTKGQAIILKYTKDGSVHTNGDQCKMYNMKAPGMVQTGTVTKEIARKVKKAYVSVNGVARKVKKMYRGVEGIARCVLNHAFGKFGNAPDLSSARTRMGYATVGDYALFAGGGSVATVDVYDSSFTHTTATNLTNANYGMGSESVGNYALFAGGYWSSGGSVATYNNVDAYDGSLTKKTATALGATKRFMASTKAGEYAIFAGGEYSVSFGNWTDRATVDAYNASLTKYTPTNLSTAVGGLTGTRNGSYALIGGGSRASTGSGSKTLDAYDSSLTKSSPATLSDAVGSKTSATTGKYAIFAGGSYSDVVDAYDTSFTHVVAPVLDHQKTDLTGVSAEGCVLIAGGFYSGTNYVTVEVYDDSLTKSYIDPLSVSPGQNSLAAPKIGDYVLFGGFSGSPIVDIYKIA
jgi:hypothetical protein